LNVQLAKRRESIDWKIVMCSPECSSTLAQPYVLQLTIASDASFAGIIAVNVEDRTPAVPNATDLIILCYMEPSANFPFHKLIKVTTPSFFWYELREQIFALFYLQ
jgi:hypothetical protein